MAGDPRSGSTHPGPPSIHRNPPAAWLGLIPTPFLPQACRISQCLCLGSFSLDRLLFFLSKSLLACHSFQEAISAIFAPLTALSPSPGSDYLSIPALTVLFTTLHDTSYNGHCNDNSICCPPWFNKQTPQGQGPWRLSCFVFMSELFPWKTLRGCTLVSALLLLQFHIGDEIQPSKKKKLDPDEEPTLNPLLFLSQLRS